MPSPPLLFPVAQPSTSPAPQERQVYLHSRDRTTNTATEQNNPYKGPILYALGYLTTPARIAEAAALRGFGVCGDPELTVHAFLRRLENATGVCEGNGLMEVRMARDAANGSNSPFPYDGQTTGMIGGGRKTETSGGVGEVLWLIIVKGMSACVEDMVVPDVLLQRFQESMPTEEMPVLYRIAADSGGVGKVQTKGQESETRRLPATGRGTVCHCPRRSRIVLGYTTSPEALFQQALRTGTDVRGDFAATLERILRRIRRLTGRPLSDTVLKLSDGGWLVVVADVAELAGVAGETHSAQETLDVLYSQCSDATISACDSVEISKVSN
ncbi:hypothetical protein EV714DRAFT_273743 [Schizophyllum commune]